MKIHNREKGITLMALVITIIILLILAGITIAQLTGSRLFENAKLAKERTEEAERLQNQTLGEYENKIEKYLDGDRNNTTSNVLWKRTSTSEKNEIIWTESIENYEYLIIQCDFSGSTIEDLGAQTNFWVDVKSVMEKGYITENFSAINSHVFAAEYSNYYMYWTFTSDKSLTVPIANGRSINDIRKITGIKL